MPSKKWYQQKVDSVLKKVKSIADGLTVEEAKKRLTQQGKNILPKAPPLPGLKIFFNQFRSAMVLILVAASTISFALGDFVDGWIIAVAVIINVVVGWLQEYRAERSLDKLREAVTYKSVVLRDGKEHQIDSTYVVVGDIVVLRTGDHIPADCRVIKSVSLYTNEAALTGESFPVEKIESEISEDKGVGDQANMVFMGTTVARGEGRAVVVSTKNKTEIGKIAELVKATKEESTPLQKQLQNLGKTLSYIVLAISILIFSIGVIANKDVVQMFTTAVAVAVAAVPEGLVIGITVILTIGMQRMLKKKALTRRLLAAETLGSTTIICTDKTGTLTEGQMHVVGIIASDNEYDTDKISAESKHPEHVVQLLKIGMLCNDAFIENEDAELKDWKVIGNPTERALLAAGNKLGFRKSRLDKEMPRLDTIPFSSERKYMMTLHRAEKKHRQLLAKGAPENILNMSDRYLDGDKVKGLSKDHRDKLRHKFDQLSGKGLRLLALAYSSVGPKVNAFHDLNILETPLIFTGFVIIKDPLRASVNETIESVKQAGVKVAMITGDHHNTAKAIAGELGLPNESQNILDGDELKALSDHDLVERVEKVSVYARVSPRDKLRIVDALQARGEVVAMTGDGVNDAPALRSADIGVALGSGTAVAKETASMVLMDNNFKSIVSAIRQGRVIFDNMRKLVTYLIADSFTQVILIGTSLIISIWIKDFPLPLIAAQILWINLITDGFPHIALTVEPEEVESMKVPPRPASESIISPQMRMLIISVSLITALITLGLFWFYWHSTGDAALARSVAFAALGIDTLLFAFSVKSLRHSIFSLKTFNNRWLIFAIGIGLIMQLLALYLPALQNVFQIVSIGLNEWILVIISAVIVIMMIELIKVFYRRRLSHQHGN
ncbi:cation-translocating P-type ATPase [Patescibacteria group bacterium]